MKYLALSCVCFLLLCSRIMADMNSQQKEAEQLGYRIMAVQNALNNPMAEDAMDVILTLGGDSRYYALTRGWLTEQLRGDLSIHTSSKQQAPALIQQRIKFLESAIRAIDLE